jgi:hypothetical protein
VVSLYRNNRKSPARGPHPAKPRVLSFANGLTDFAKRPHPDCKPGERTMTIARSLYEDLEIIPVDAPNTEIAVSLLHRFFQEEGFSDDRSIIAANLEWMRRDDYHLAALALNKGHFVGIVTVTSMELFRFCGLTESPHFRRSTRRSHRLGSAGALVSTDLHCQNMSKAAISASTWRSSGECRLRRNPPTRIQLLGISYAI